MKCGSSTVFVGGWEGVEVGRGEGLVVEKEGRERSSLGKV